MGFSRKLFGFLSDIRKVSPVSPLINVSPIFISSNVRVISGNPDFFNRVDLIELTVEDRKLQSIEDLNQKRVTSTIDKKELVSKILTGRE